MKLKEILFETGTNEAALKWLHAHGASVSSPIDDFEIYIDEIGEGLKKGYSAFNEFRRGWASAKSFRFCFFFADNENINIPTEVSALIKKLLGGAELITATYCYGVYDKTSRLNMSPKNIRFKRTAMKTLELPGKYDLVTLDSISLENSVLSLLKTDYNDLVMDINDKKLRDAIRVVNDAHEKHVDLAEVVEQLHDADLEEYL